MTDFKCEDTRDLDKDLTNYRVNTDFYISFNKNTNNLNVGIGEDMFKAQVDYHKKLDANNNL